MPSTDKGEAVCFTAGPQGAAFGAGVIHAWLAADRKAPNVVSGISMGAITAAAMQRAMIERGPAKQRTEASRWEWFQGYLTDMLDRPLDVVWKGFPDPLDYFASSMPVRDLSCPDELKADERAFRYHFWCLTKIGNWIAKLPTSIGDVMQAAILKVRLEEAIPVPVLGMSPLAHIWRWGTFLSKVFSIAVQVIHVVIWHPGFMRTYDRFVYDELKRQASGPEGTLTPEEGSALGAAVAGAGIRTGGLWYRPLLGWKVWLCALLLEAIFPVALFIAAGLYLAGITAGAVVALGVVPLGILAAIVGLIWFFHKKSLASRLAIAAKRFNEDGSLKPDEPKGFAANLKLSAMQAANIDLNLISNYPLRRRIWNRFFDPHRKDVLEVNGTASTETKLVVVAAVLQQLPGVNQQVCARDGYPLVDALVTACAAHPIFPPRHIAGEAVEKWIRPKLLKKLRAEGTMKREFDLIDGAVIRKNPLPALFNWLQDNPDVAESLRTGSKADSKIHVIYSVPIEPFDANNGKSGPDRIDLVESAEVGILMRARRDTSIEVRQTNFLSKVISAQRDVGSHKRNERFAIFADEIAPARELDFKNPLSPTRDEGLKVVAEGCRRTLGRLYESELTSAVGNAVNCGDFLKEIAKDRNNGEPVRGLPEICAMCSGRLEAYPVPKRVPNIVKSDFGQVGKLDLTKALPNLCNNSGPKVTFVASGGVFAGSFHIGLIGAMHAMDIVPDLIVGASVGTLMGGALAAIRNSPEKYQQLRLLAQLTDTFLRVDEKVALTVPLKTAVKQLGLRGRGLALSPARLRAAVQAGTTVDPGYAATGVPPLVTDTLARLLIIPPSKTFEVGASFLSGHFAEAAAALISMARKNTLESLEVQYAVIGTSLLEGVARSLLEGEQVCTGSDWVGTFNLDQRQPYLDFKESKGTAIFCTTAYVNQRWLLVLGRDSLFSPSPKFSFLYAALSSSAFPAAFPARQEREVFPGMGKLNNLFCDGGTFDNLPFMPTVELLSQTQKQRFLNRKEVEKNLTERNFLDERLNAPDLILSGGFDPVAAKDRRQKFQSQGAVSARSKELTSAVKTDSFVAMSNRVAEHLQDLSEAIVKHGLPTEEEATKRVNDVMVRSVVAGVINLVPATEWHVNPAFGFSRTLGFEKDRIGASIANGCFQTLINMQQRRHTSDAQRWVLRSLVALKIDVKLRGKPKDVTSKAGECPFFQVMCPFFAASKEIAKGLDKLKENAKGLDKSKELAKHLEQILEETKKADGSLAIYLLCVQDPVHQKLIQIDTQGVALD